MRKLFLLVFGLGLGLVAGAILVRRVDQAAQSVAPANLARSAGAAASTLGERFRAAAAETRAASAEREAELRAEFQVPRVSDVLRAPEPPQGA